MANEIERTSHVTATEYAEAAQLCIGELKQSDPNTYRMKLLQKVSPAFMHYTRYISGILVPYDRTLGAAPEDEQKQIKRATTTGSLLALHIAATAYKPVTIDSEQFRHVGFEAEGSIDSDQLHAKHELTEATLEYGWSGLELVGDETAELIEENEHLFAPDITKQLYVRIGAGITFRVLYENFESELERRRIASMEEFKNQVASVHDFDWDAALNKLSQD